MSEVVAQLALPVVAPLIQAEGEAAVFLHQLSIDNGYPAARDLGCGVYCAVRPFMYSWALLVGEIGDTTGYFDRYCYGSFGEALAALMSWSGEGDPGCGWHRHPASGRRRPDGDPAREYVWH